MQVPSSSRQCHSQVIQLATSLLPSSLSSAEASQGPGQGDTAALSGLGLGAETLRCTKQGSSPNSSRSPLCLGPRGAPRRHATAPPRTPRSSASSCASATPPRRIGPKFLPKLGRMQPELDKRLKTVENSVQGRSTVCQVRSSMAAATAARRAVNRSDAIASPTPPSRRRATLSSARARDARK